MKDVPALTARDLLAVWEGGAGESLTQRALRLLSAARPDLSAAWAQMPLGQRDAALLALRAELLGPRLLSVAVCAQCGEHLQLTLDTSTLAATPALDAAPQTLTVAPYVLRYRLLNSTDLLAAAQCDSVEAARAVLLERCLQAAECNQAAVPFAALPEDVVAALAAHMAQADPQADLQLEVCCPTCGHVSQAALDVMAYLWAEIDRWAHRLLGEVHILASAYGWSEADILALSAARRQAYLDLIRE